jgi:hypothetical protein
VRYTRGQCTAQGIFIMVTLEINTPEFQLLGTGKGAKHCVHPADPLAVRYEFSLAVEKLVLAGGAFVISDVLIEVGLGGNCSHCPSTNCPNCARFLSKIPPCDVLSIICQALDGGAGVRAVPGRGHVGPGYGGAG